MSDAIAPPTVTIRVPGVTIGNSPSGNSYTATLTTYDGYDAGTQTATGNVLSTGQNVGFTIHPGQANTIALALSGVPAQLVVIPLTPLSTGTLSNTGGVSATGATAIVLSATGPSGSLAPRTGGAPGVAVGWS